MPWLFSADQSSKSSICLWRRRVARKYFIFSEWCANLNAEQYYISRTASIRHAPILYDVHAAIGGISWVKRGDG